MYKGTYEGTEEEKAFVKGLNRNKKSEYWEILGMSEHSEISFAIHITQHKHCKILGKKIKPKADLFIAGGEIPEEFLRQRDFYLDEDDIKKFMLRKIEFSGISVKRSDSSHYQILKMNPSTFKRFFGSYELGAGASIYCSKPSGLGKNDDVLKGWNTDWVSFKKFFSCIYNIGFLNNNEMDPIERIEIAHQVKSCSNKRISEEIIKKNEISSYVFTGIGYFEEPYSAHWFFEKGTLKKAGPVPFIITTGSGRSRGDFTVVVKPK